MDETARSDLDSEPGALVMDLSSESVSFSTLVVTFLLTVDYFQNYDKSYLALETPCDEPGQPKIRMRRRSTRRGFCDKWKRRRRYRLINSI